jgi:hypothetical protein
LSSAAAADGSGVPANGAGGGTDGLSAEHDGAR